MNVNKVSATLRYSREEKGAWKSLELGVEASLDDRERWQAVQASLYAQLASQFKQLWAANGTTPTEKPPEGHPIDVQPSEIPSGPEGKQNLERWCREHSVEVQRRTGKNGTFYSHKAPDGSWCNEKKGAPK